MSGSIVVIVCKKKTGAASVGNLSTINWDNQMN